MSRSLSLVLPILLLLTSDLKPQSRLQFSLENDSNIRETPSAALAARSLRILVQSHKPGRNAWSSISFQQVSALQVYWNHPEENKLVSELRLGNGGMIGRLRIRTSAWGRLKLWLNDIFDYGSGGLRVDASLPLTSRLAATAEVHLGALDYAQLDGFDSRDFGAGAGLAIRKQRRSFGLDLSWQTIRFDRSAVVAQFTPDPVYRFLAQRQTDRVLSAALSVSQTQGVLARLSYEFQRDDSNSFGFSYWRHRLQLLLGARLRQHITLRLLAAAQIKHYLETLPAGVPSLPRDLDTEREQSNFVVVDLSRPITPTLNAVLRLAWYSNETPLRNRFYRKSLATLAVEARF